MATTEGTPFSAAAYVHPSMMDPEGDAPKIAVPLAILASSGEDPATVSKYIEHLKVPKFTETYSEAPHVSCLVRTLN
jgi:hypothetical protein